MQHTVLCPEKEVCNCIYSCSQSIPSDTQVVKLNLDQVKVEDVSCSVNHDINTNQSAGVTISQSANICDNQHLCNQICETASNKLTDTVNTDEKQIEVEEVVDNVNADDNKPTKLIVSVQISFVNLYGLYEEFKLPAFVDTGCYSSYVCGDFQLSTVECESKIISFADGKPVTVEKCVKCNFCIPSYIDYINLQVFVIDQFEGNKSHILLGLELIQKLKIDIIAGELLFINDKLYD